MTKNDLRLMIYEYNQNRKVKDPKMTMQKLSYMLFPELTESTARTKLSKILAGKRKEPKGFYDKVKELLS